jgi:hypothetical protein
MADADTNKTQDTSQGSPAGTGGATGARSGGGTASAQSAPSATAQTDGGQKYFVDNRSVPKEEYLKAAEENGYDLSRMPENFFPAIGTKKHGEV